MSYAEEILSGLTEVPCPQYPGDIIVRGKAEPVLISMATIAPTQSNLNIYCRHPQNEFISVVWFIW